mgnify:CR=1 FL=1
MLDFTYRLERCQQDNDEYLLKMVEVGTRREEYRDQRLTRLAEVDRLENLYLQSLYSSRSAYSSASGLEGTTAVELLEQGPLGEMHALQTLPLPR